MKLWSALNRWIFMMYDVLAIFMKCKRNTKWASIVFVIYVWSHLSDSSFSVWRHFFRVHIASGEPLTPAHVQFFCSLNVASMALAVWLKWFSEHLADWQSVRKWYSHVPTHWGIHPMAWGLGQEQLLHWHLCSEPDLSQKLDVIITPNALYVNNALLPQLWPLCSEPDLSQKLDVIITPDALYVNSALLPQLWPLCSRQQMMLNGTQTTPSPRSEPCQVRLMSVPRTARCKCSILRPGPFQPGIGH